MNKSSRHHYIPRFLINKFTDTDGMLYVFNKKQNKFIGKHSPKSIFFGWDRNTVDIGGEPNDHLEKLYAELEADIAPKLENVLRTKTLSPEELMAITILATMLKWRSPIIDEEFNAIKNNLTNADLSVSIRLKTDNIADDEKAMEHLRDSQLFNESKRVMLAIRPLMDKEIHANIYKNSFINTNDKFQALIGDCPIIEKTNSDFKRIENFIFPISTTDTFIYCENKYQHISNSLFYLQRDLAVFHLSENYVACRDENRLKNIVKTYEKIKNEGDVSSILKFAFNTIE